MVKGNTRKVERPVETEGGSVGSIEVPSYLEDDTVVQNLRFGDGPLLREGEGDANDAANSLRDRHIIRVGWDDVRGWMGEVSAKLSWGDIC